MHHDIHCLNPTGNRNFQRAARFSTCMALCLLTFGCTTTESSYWTDYGAWTDWRQVDEDYKVVTVISEPPGAAIYLDGKYSGKTPKGLSLSYPLLGRTRGRHKKQQYLSETESLMNAVISVGTLGTIPEYNRPHVKGVASQQEEDRKAGSSTYTISVYKEGYLPQSTQFEASNRNASTVEFRLVRKPRVIVCGFSVLRAVDTSSGVMNWLWWNVFSSTKKIKEDDFPRLGRELAQDLAENISQQADLFSVSPRIADIPAKEGPTGQSIARAAAREGAQLAVCGEVQIGRESIEINVQLIDVRSNGVVCIEKKGLDIQKFPENTTSAMASVAKGLADCYPQSR